MRVKEIVEKIKKEGAHLGDEFISAETKGSSQTHVVANRPTERAILIGHSDNGNVKCFNINLSKWIWAETEGFSRDQIVDELWNQVFEEIPVSTPIKSIDIVNVAKELRNE